MADRPNVLLIFTDQQRHDTIAALGNSVIRTPNLDRLVRGGVAFTSAYTPSPVCISARCSLHYGQYPTHTGCYDNGFPMPDDRASFMDVLTAAGYRTHGIGKCHFSPDAGALRGFQTRQTQHELSPHRGDDYMCFLDDNGFGDVADPNGVRSEMYYIPQLSQLPPRLHPTQWVGDNSAAFIEGRASEKQPWVLFSSYIHPHPPFAPPRPWHKLYRAWDMPDPHVPEDTAALHTFINRHQNRYKYRDQGLDRNLLRCMKAHYYACISFIDLHIGRTLDALEQTGQMDNTLIVFTSDHGEHLGDYNCFGKRSMHDSCARVPLIAQMSGRIDGGRICNDPASLVDVMPTMFAAAGCNRDEVATDGVDLAELAAGGCRRDAVHSQFNAGADAIYTTVTNRWKYAYSAPDGAEYLFDRAGDPPETRNAAADSPDALAEMRSRTIAFAREGARGNDAVDGNTWKTYPRKDVPADPDAGLLVQDPAAYRNLDLPGYTD